jgi:hypothetical protein
MRFILLFCVVSSAKVRLWDLNMSRCMGKCKVSCGPSARPCVAFDNQGVVFAIGTGSERGGEAKLFDLRSYEQGPFQTISLPNKVCWKTGQGLQVRPNGGVCVSCECRVCVWTVM